MMAISRIGRLLYGTVVRIAAAQWGPSTTDVRGPLMETLNGKVAVVTGGSRGIGFAIARMLVGEGARVAITGRDEGHLSAARPQLENAAPGSVEALKADVRKYEEVERAVNATVARFGG